MLSWIFNTWNNETGENVPHLEITQVVLVDYNIFNNDYQQDSIVLYTFWFWYF